MNDLIDRLRESHGLGCPYLYRLVRAVECGADAEDCVFSTLSAMSDAIKEITARAVDAEMRAMPRPIIVPLEADDA